VDNVEQENGLTAQLLGTWWAVAFDALIEAAGSERALEAIKPHMRNAGAGGTFFIKRRMGWEKETIENACMTLALAHTFFGRSVDHAMAREDAECLIRISDCPFSHGPKETCIGLCYHALQGMGPAFGRDMEVDMPKMMKSGDQFCIKYVKRAGVVSNLDPTEWREVGFHLEDLSREEREWFFMSYMGEMWMIVLRAFNDLFGEEETMNALVPRMRAQGLLLSAQLRMERADMLPGDAVVAVVKAMGQTFVMTRQGDVSLLLIEECPLSGSREACYLYEAFLDGVCNGLKGDSGFSYQHRMTEGHDVCRATIH